MTAPGQVPVGLAKSDWQSIRAAYETERHAFQPTDGGWQARNPGQQWTTKFDKRGFLTEPLGGGWQWGLELKSYGFGSDQHAVGGTIPEVKSTGQRLTYCWNAAVQEWWVNDARGLEHGFTVRERPFPTSPKLPVSDSPRLGFLLKVRGTLQPNVSSDGQGVLFADATGASVLNYTGLKVWDADGRVLASHFEPAEGGLRLLVEERGARYPLTIDPVAQLAYLKPTAVGTTQEGDSFGYSVAVSGDTVVIGAPYEASSTTGVNSTPDESASYSGAAYVFVRTAGVWTQQAYLKPAAVGTTQSGDEFGSSVAISGDTVVVGAPNEASSTTGVNSTPDESANFSGAAYVFVRNAGVWTQQAYLKPAAVGTTQAVDRFGSSVAVSGDTLVVGAPSEDGGTTGVNSTPDESASSSGAAYIFARSAGVWTQQAYLKQGAIGLSQVGDEFGISVAVSGETVVVGAYYEDSSTTGVNSTPDDAGSYNSNPVFGPVGYNFTSGAAYVFVRSAGVWTQQAYLKRDVSSSGGFGFSVSISGETIVGGAVFDNTACVFVRSAGVWTQQASLTASATPQAFAYFGYSVAISGETVVVGAVEEDSSTTGVNSTPNNDGTANGSGAAYVFLRSAGVWTQEAYLKPSAVGTTQAGDYFGNSVAVSGGMVIVGAPYEDSSTLGVNSAANESASGSGAVYTYSGLPEADIAVFNGAGTMAADERVDGTTYDFGAAAVGGSRVRTFTLLNAGESSLGGIGVSFSGGSGEFSHSAPGASSLSSGVTTNFTVTFAPTSVGVQTRTLVISSGDPDEGSFEIHLTGQGLLPPAITLDPHSAMVGLGQPVNLSGAATGTAVQFQWLCNGSPVTGATSATYAIPAATMGHVGEWQLRASNGVGAVTSQPASFGVVDLSARAVSIAAGGILVLQIPAAAPGAAYRWLRGGVAIPRGINPEIQLILRGIAADQAGLYSLQVTMPDPQNPSTPLVMQSGAVNVNVSGGGASSALSQAVVNKPILLPFTPGPWIVGGAVRDVIPALNAPTRFAVRGLPTGVKLNALTGEISGRPAVAIQVPTRYPLTITASNAAGSSAALKTDVIVHPLPGYTAGNFHGLVSRHDTVNAGHGGRIQITVSPLGSLTGRLVLGAASHSFAGKIDPPEIGVDATAEIRISRARPLAALNLAFTIQRLTGELTGQVWEQSGTVATLSAWRQAEGAAAHVGRFEIALTPAGAAVGDAAYPQTGGTLRLSISRSGVPSWSGKLADGATITGSSSLGRLRTVPLHHFNATTRSSLQGWLQLSPASDAVDGSLDWLRLFTQTTAPSFPLHDLQAAGARTGMAP